MSTDDAAASIRRGGRRRWRRLGARVGVGLGAVLVLLVGLALVVGCAISGPRYRGASSDHFDGKRFRNMRDVPSGGFGGFLKWQLSRQRGPWRQRELIPFPPPPPRVARGELRVTFVNHATVLVQMDGFNVLADPIWSERASPFSWVGPRRFHAPGVRFEDLPPIDAVVVSHNHYDHMDLPTLRRLAAAHHPQFFVGLGNGPLLREAGLDRVTELDWWQEASLGPEVRIAGVPAQHFSNRGLCDRDATLWLGYVLVGPAGVSYLAGDTGAGPHFAAIGRRFGKPRLAVLPIGAYRPEWFMSPVHVAPAEAVAAQEILGAATAVGMHFGTFALADDGQDEPVQALAAALARRGSSGLRFWALAPGEGRSVPPS
jgi:L-ascorbate metabolism protein UlaG (beta-lactamase superfamily)